MSNLITIDSSIIKIIKIILKNIKYQRHNTVIPNNKFLNNLYKQRRRRAIREYPESVGSLFFHRQLGGEQAVEKHEIRGWKPEAGQGLFKAREQETTDNTQREGQFTSSSGVLPVINLLAARLSDIISRKLGAWLITLNEQIPRPFRPLSNSFLCSCREGNTVAV